MTGTIDWWHSIFSIQLVALFHLSRVIRRLKNSSSHWRATSDVSSNTTQPIFITCLSLWSDCHFFSRFHPLSSILKALFSPSLVTLTSISSRKHDSESRVSCWARKCIFFSFLDVVSFSRCDGFDCFKFFIFIIVYLSSNGGSLDNDGNLIFILISNKNKSEEMGDRKIHELGGTAGEGTKFSLNSLAGKSSKKPPGDLVYSDDDDAKLMIWMRGRPGGGFDGRARRLRRRILLNSMEWFAIKIENNQLRHFDGFAGGAMRCVLSFIQISLYSFPYSAQREIWNIAHFWVSHCENVKLISPPAERRGPKIILVFQFVGRWSSPCEIGEEEKRKNDWIMAIILKNFLTSPNNKFFLFLVPLPLSNTFLANPTFPALKKFSKTQFQFLLTRESRWTEKKVGSRAGSNARWIFDWIDGKPPLTTGK